jgi:DNA-binding winged helix-turn-helix (wHTH) protein
MALRCLAILCLSFSSKLFIQGDFIKAIWPTRQVRFRVDLTYQVMKSQPN